MIFNMAWWKVVGGGGGSKISKLEIRHAISCEYLSTA